MTDIGVPTGRGRGKGKQRAEYQGDDPQPSNGKSAEECEKFILTRLRIYRENNVMDQNLWQMYRADFAGWHKDTFTKCDEALLILLRDNLRRHGVWVIKDPNLPAQKALTATLFEDTQKVWTQHEIEQHIATDGAFNSVTVSTINNRNSFFSTTPKLPPPPEQRFPLPESPVHLEPQRLPHGGTPSPSPGLTPDLGRATYGNRMGFRREIENSFDHDPRDNETNEFGGKFNRALANLTKMYTEKMQYGGENDNFDFKLTIFHNLCKRAGIPLNHRNEAYPAMLRDLALEHFFINLNNNSVMPPLEELCDKTRNYFEGPVYCRSILGQWETLTIKTVTARTENSSKTTLDCLKLLIMELRHLQLGLDPELRTEKLL